MSRVCIIESVHCANNMIIRKTWSWAFLPVLFAM